MVTVKKHNGVRKADRLRELIEKIDEMQDLKEMIGSYTHELDAYKREIKEEMEGLGYASSKTKADGTKIPGDKLVATKCIAQLVGGHTGSKLNTVKLLEAGVSTITIAKCTDPGKPTLSLRLDPIK